MVLVLGVLLAAALMGGMQVGMPTWDPVFLKKTESDFLKALERRKMLKDKNEFNSPPLPFVPISSEFLTDMCMEYGKLNGEEPHPHIETNFLCFKMQSRKLLRPHPVKAEMLRCNSKYAIMDIGHASHIYILRLGRFRKKYQEQPLFHIVDQFVFEMETAKRRVKLLSEEFPLETHHQEELPTKKEIKKMNEYFEEMNRKKESGGDDFLH